MVDIKSLWIGDLLKTSSGKIVKFEGIAGDGRARVNYLGKILLVDANNISLEKEEDDFPHHLLQDFLEDKLAKEKSKPLKIKINNTLDLHIEVLAPEMKNDYPGRIIEYQMLRCKQFIEDAITRRLPHITIIHGKGTGTLKNEVESLLRSYHEMRFQVSKNDGGAIDVWVG